ncbi:hypothetical protein M3P05_04415 [Sansalvadorimonas sp. 2012CJ34-2]|uniref:Uncharacterized protein n=1 Tax=Parendozoicomonas callyspongiae TaxID=2942213 RepID=A0ABT0PCS6_9GAMM|nr:hypothetical protein [Sansalvadorimonas sp. 2012CJ34-2]MCL6269187.1 hypothetical protein [Sansalvadorimonas sp. 2012CJ34-2]
MQQRTTAISRTQAMPLEVIPERSNVLARSSSDGHTVTRESGDSQVFISMIFDCWRLVKVYLSARDVLALRHTCQYFFTKARKEHPVPGLSSEPCRAKTQDRTYEHFELDGSLIVNDLDPFGLSRNQIITNFLVERYFTRHPGVQSVYRKRMVPQCLHHKDQYPRNVERWISKHFDEQEKVWAMSDVLRQGALSRRLSNSTHEIESVTTLSGFSGGIICMTIASGGRVISGSSGNTLTVWNLTKPLRKQPITSLKVHSDWIYRVSTLPNGWVVSGSYDTNLKVWDLTETPKVQCVATLRGHSSGATCITTTPEGLVISGSYDGTLKVWDLARAGGLCVATLKGHSDKIICMTITSEGLVISGSDDTTLKVWDLYQSINPDMEWLERKKP